MAANKRKSHFGNRGQALFEFVIIVPFILILIGSLVAIIGAINSSINQVKATRNYFFMTINNNSMFPNTVTLNNLKDRYGRKQVSIDMVGWSEKREQNRSYAPCFKITTFLGEEPKNENCDAEVEESYSTFIKVKTLYGVCSGTYDLSGEYPRLNLADSNCYMR